MEIDDIKKALSDALQAPEDKNLKSRYCDSLADYLKDNEASDEIISIVLSGIDLDRAATFFDYLADLSKNNFQRIWKQVRQSTDLKEGPFDNSLKFLSCILSMSFLKIGTIGNLCGYVLTALVEMITDKKNPVSEKTYGPILCGYFMEDLKSGKSLPQWNEIKASDEVCRQFASILLKITDGENAKKYPSFRLWADRGLSYTEEQIKKRKIEERIPKSRTDDLSAIAEHYKAVEKQLREDVYEIAKLQDEIAGLNRDINASLSEKHDLEGQIRALNEKLNVTQQQLENAEREVSEHAAINEAFGALKKNDENALLKDIANELKAEYQDFIETESDEMDVVLGEIYREKLKNIFKILGRKGIRME